jgi:hypothetical protein
MMHDEIAQSLTGAALDLAEEALFETVSFRSILERAGFTMADCAAAGITMAKLLDLLDRDLDRQMLEAATEVDPAQSAKDRLFEVVIARFDALEARRAAWTSILLAERGQPREQAARIARRGRTASWVLMAAGIKQSGLTGAARLVGVTRILRLCETAWLQDGPELSATMACLDKELSAGGRMLARMAAMRDRFSGQTASTMGAAQKPDEDTSSHVVH